MNMKALVKRRSVTRVTSPAIADDAPVALCLRRASSTATTSSSHPTQQWPTNWCVCKCQVRTCLLTLRQSEGTYDAAAPLSIID